MLNVTLVFSSLISDPDKESVLIIMNENFSENSKKVDIKLVEPETVESVNYENDKEEAVEIRLEEMPTDALVKKIEKLEEEVKINYDKYLRSQAELENIIKRNKKDKEEWIKYSNETLIKDLLQVIDNLEKALSHSTNEKSLNALIEGVELTLKGLKDTLSKSGLEEVKALGEKFDPLFHHAVQTTMSDSVEKGRILQEFQKGYTLNQRLIRPAMVIISKGNPDDSSQKTFSGASEE